MRHEKTDSAPAAGRPASCGARATRGTGGAGDAPVLQGFAPVTTPQARVLVLGSMPGAISLRQGRYYAHPRNAFWPIAAEILGFDPALDYALRLERLTQAGVALWDVLQRVRARRQPGRRHPQRGAQRLRRFPACDPRLRRVCLNGGKAASLFRRQVLPSPPAALADLLVCLDLPSTSPAHAAISYEQKLAAWRSGYFAAGQG